MRKEVLEKYPAAKLKVYAIWFNMVQGDSKQKWPEDLLSDPRTIHWWDEEKIVGTWYAKQPQLSQYGSVLWDAFLVYAPEAQWDEKPSHLVAKGRTIIEDREKLRSGLQPLLNHE